MQNCFSTNATAHDKRECRLKKKLNRVGSTFWNLLLQALMEADSISRFREVLGKFLDDKIVNGC